MHRFVPDTDARETVELVGQPSFVVPDENGNLVIGSNHDIWRLTSGKAVERIATIAQPAHNRTNDATVDSRGRLWFGTMDDAEQRETGTLYCLDKEGIHSKGCPAIVTNGPAISPDCDTLYHVDSVNRRIWRYTIRDGTELTDQHLFVEIANGGGYPDGVTLDSEGCLWVALWDGGAVRRYARGGGLLLTVSFPCSRVTKLAFGASDLKTAFVTTASIGLTPGQRTQQPLAGSLFAFDSPVAGILAYLAAV